MKKTILITGATDGIGLETAKSLISQGHHVLLHGRNQTKLEDIKNTLSTTNNKDEIESYIADLSDMTDVEALAQSVLEKHNKLDVLINNAGIFRTHQPITQDGLDIRFVVNTIAPYLLTQKLMPLFDNTARVINLSSAAQDSVNLSALQGQIELGDEFSAYAQSKLAITMWSVDMAKTQKNKGPMIVAVNPGSMLGSKMVKEGFGVAGNDISIGVDILVRAALSDEFTDANGKYFDNDSGTFTSAHSDSLDPQKCAAITHTIEATLSKLLLKA